MSDLKSQEIGYGEKIGSGGSDAILSSYFRNILVNLHIDITRFQALLDKYIISQGIANNSAELSTSRSALRRELMSMTMTWKVFIKGLMFLRVESMMISLILYRDDNKTTVHDYEFKLVDDKSVEDSDDQPNVLATFFKEILENLEIDEDQHEEVFKEYLDHYVRFSKPGSSPNEQYTAKCSLRREISKANISWKVFMKGLIFLRTYKMIINLKLKHRNNLITKHTKTLRFR